MKTNYTPGPWTSHAAYFFGKESFMVSGTNGDSSPFICRTVAETGDNPETAEANARLIAAAPDLLNMLRRVMDEYSMRAPSAGPIALLTLEQARAAIAKAEGEA